MAGSSRTSSRRFLAGVALTAIAFAWPGAAPVRAQQAAQEAAAPVVRDPDLVDLRDLNKETEAWRKAEYEKLRKQGRATAAEFRKIDAEALSRARATEAHRTRALEALSKQAGGIPLEQGPAGTNPLEGRGSLGDVDTRSMSPRDYDKVMQAAKKAGYTVKPQGDAFTIVELDTTVHRASAAEMHYGSAEPVGGSGRQAEIARGQNPETAMGHGRNDPSIAVSDNLKKAAHTLDTPPGEISNSDLQKLGKMTERNIKAIEDAAKAGGQAAAGVDPLTRQQAELLKQGYSPEAAGIVRDNATPAERAQDIADFQKRSRTATVEAVRAGDVHAASRMEGLAAEARTANEALDAAKASGDARRIASAQSRANAAHRAVIEYHELRTAAQASAVVNEPNAAKVIAEARGVNTQGRSPSQIREAAVAPDRKALTSAAAEPAKAPKLAVEPAKAPGAADAPAADAPGEGGSPGSRLMKAANILLIGYAIYHGITRGAEEAGKEAAQEGDGSLTSTIKTGLYSVWYGLGIGSAVETGQKAGEASAQQWGKDVQEGKVDPTSRLSQAWAQIRAVGWGLAEFTGLQAVKDATAEGVGLVQDRYTQYKNEKAEAEARAEASQRPPRSTQPGRQAPAPAADPDATQPPPAQTAHAGTQPRPADMAAKDKSEADRERPKDSAGIIRDAGREAAGRTARPIGQAIGAAGVAALKQPPPQLPGAPAATPAQPAAAPPPATTEVEAGWIRNQAGMSKLVYINDAAGNRIGGYYVHYDAQGREIGRESFKESPAAPEQAVQQPGSILSGEYKGRIGGQASGSMSITVAGASVSGSITGVYKGDRFTSTFSATLKADGSFSGAAKGVLQGEFAGKISPYPFDGTVSGRVDGTTGSGNWSGKNQYGGATGSWQASK